MFFRSPENEEYTLASSRRISIGLLDLGTAIVGSLTITVSLGVLTTCFLALLGVIGVADGAGMLVGGAALMTTGVGFYTLKADFGKEMIKAFSFLAPCM